jgi:hypothetical protein
MCNISYSAGPQHLGNIPHAATRDTKTDTGQWHWFIQPADCCAIVRAQRPGVVKCHVLNLVF